MNFKGRAEDVRSGFGTIGRNRSRPVLIPDLTSLNSLPAAEELELSHRLESFILGVPMLHLNPRALVAAVVGAILLPISLTATDAAEDPIAPDEAALRSAMAALRAADQDARDKAAIQVREIIARHASGTANILEADGGRARWTEQIGRIATGATEKELTDTLKPLFAAARIGGAGGSMRIKYQLDEVWACWVSLSPKNRGKGDERVVMATPEMFKSNYAVHVPIPDGFSGVWRDYLNNGQKNQELQVLKGAIVSPKSPGEPAKK